MTDTTIDNLPIERPPDSEVMTYSELRHHFQNWPVWLIDELAYGLKEDEASEFY